MIAVAQRFALASVIWLAAVAPMAAQGKSASAHGKKGAAAAAAATVSPATATSSTSAPSTAANSVLYYGSWLDDASVMAPRTTWLAASTAYWSAGTARQVDAPVFLLARGLTRRMQVGGSVPIFHFRDDSGFAASGVGTISMYGKMMLLDPAGDGNVGVAIAPLIEMAPGADGAFGWALPVNIETRRDRFRVYGSAGYFSRGSVFGSVAVEVPAGARAAVTGNFGESHAGGAQQITVGVGLSFFPTPITGLFVSIGHSSDAQGLTNGGVSIGGGFSILKLGK